MLRFGTEFLAHTLARWVEFVLGRARIIVALSLLVTAALFYYTFQNISINTDTDEMIDPDLGFRKTYAAFNEAFPQIADSFLVVIDAASPEEAELAAAGLVAGLEARPGLFQHPYAPGLGPFFDRNAFLYLEIDELVALSDQLAGAQPILAGLAEDPSLYAFLDVLSLAAEDSVEDGEAPEALPDVLERIAEVTAATASGEEKYLSWAEIFDPGDDVAEARRRLVMVRPVPDFSRLQPTKPALLEARALARQIEEAAGGRLDVRLTGKMALGADELESVSESISVSATLSLVLVALVLGFGIRSLRLVAASLITLVSGLVWTAAFAIYVIGYLNIISVAFAVLFIGLGIDFAIHFSLRYREEAAHGKDTHAALKTAALTVGGPLSLAAPTTALAFYAFTPTDYAGLAQLGLISGTGMFIALFGSLTLLPALYVLIPLETDGAPSERPTERAGRWIERHARAITILGVLAGLGALILAPQVRFEIDPVRLKDPGSESVATFLDLLDEPKSSPYAAQLVAESPAAIPGYERRLEALETVDKVVAITSFVPEKQDEKLALLFDVATFMTPVLLADPAAEPTPVEAAAPALSELATDLSALEAALPDTEAAESAARLRQALERLDPADFATLAVLERALMRFFPNAIEKLSAGLAAEGVGLDDLPADLRARYEAADGRQRLTVFPRADLADERALKRFVRAISAAVPAATGRPVQIVRAGEVVVGAMIEATLLAAILILGFLSLVLRRVRDIGLILLPVILAAALTAAATVLLGIPFNFANVIVLPLLIGLGVDSGIHLVLRAREEHSRAGLLSTSTPRAVLLAALTTIGSFGTLALSAHRGTASMGELLMISVSLTLLAALVVLPAVLAWRSGHRSDQD